MKILEQQGSHYGRLQSGCGGSTGLAAEIAALDEVNKVRGTLPEQYTGMSLLEIYDDLGASPQAYHYSNGTVRWS